VLTQAITSAQLSKILPGRFETLDDGNKMVYATGRTYEDGQLVLKNVVLVQHTPALNNHNETWDISTASQAKQQDLLGTQTPFIVLKNGHRTGLTQGSLAVDRMAFEQYGVAVFKSKPSISVPVEGLPTSYLIKHYRESQENLSAMQYRISIVLSLFLLTFIAVPLSYVAPRHGRYVKLIPALLIYLIYMGLLLSNKSWIAHATAHLWFYLCWLQVILLLMGVVFFRYGMGPLTHRYRHRVKKVFMPWRIIKVRSNAR
jgi:lipopolysaccharide export system permease protein